MIIQPTHEQTRRVTRSRTYSGSGFGPRSFECLGMGMGLGIGLSAPNNVVNPLTIFGASATRLWLRPDLGLTYGSTPLPTAGNTSTTALTLGGTLAVNGAVPIWAKATNTAAVGSGAQFSIYVDGSGTTPIMTGVTPSVATPIAITGRAQTLAWSAGNSVANDTWKATNAGWADQSGNWGANFAQATASKQPLVGLDAAIGQLALTGDGVNDSLDSTGVFPFQSVASFAIIVVAKIPSFAVSGLPLISGNNYAPAIATFSAGRLGVQSGAAGPAIAAPSTAWKCITCELTNSTSDRLQQGATSVSAASAGGTTDINSYLFGLPTSSVWLASSIAELIVVKPIPSSYTVIYSYLAGLYGASIHT